MRFIARSIGLSVYDVKNGAIGSSLIRPFYLPINKGTTNNTSMRDVISPFTTDYSERKNRKDATNQLQMDRVSGPVNTSLVRDQTWS